MAFTSGRCSSTTRSRRAMRAAGVVTPFCLTGAGAAAAAVAANGALWRDVLIATGFTGTSRGFAFPLAAVREPGIVRTATRGGGITAVFIFIAIILINLLYSNAGLSFEPRTSLEFAVRSRCPDLRLE